MLSHGTRRQISRWAGVGLSLSIISVAAAIEFSARINHDVALNLYDVHLLVTGARLYRDVAVIHPPLWYLLLTPFALFGAAPFHLFRIAVFALSAASAVATWWILPGRPRYAVPVLLAITLLLPAYDFGEQEHVMVLLVLPSIALAARRWSGQRVPQWTAVAVGVAAAMGYSLKPPYLAAWLLLAGFERLRTRKADVLVRPEFLSVVVVGIVYIAAVTLFLPEFWALLRVEGRLYVTWAHISTLRMLQVRPILLVAAAGVLTWLRVRPDVSNRSFGDAVAVCVLGLQLGAFAQGKGFSYHVLPAAMLTALLATVMVAQKGWARVAGCVIGLTALTLAGISDAGRVTYDRTARELERAVADAGPPGRILVLTGRVRDAWPLVQHTASTWASRYPATWWLTALYPLRSAPFRSQSEMGAVERSFFKGAVQDLLHTPPCTIVTWDYGPDPLAYLSIDRFAAKLLTRYHFVKRVGPWQIRRRIPECGD